MKRHLLTALTAAAAISAMAGLPNNFVDGMFILNEDWYGKSSGTLTFINPSNEAFYRVYQETNPGRSFGNTTQFGQIYGDHIYVVSKQACTLNERSGGRLVALNAYSLEFENELETLPAGDGRSFCAVSDTKAYIGMSQGLYTMDLTTFTPGDKQLAPANDKGRVQQTGQMFRYGDKLYACQQNIGVLVVDIATDEVEVVGIPKIAECFVTPDGSLYAATSDANCEFVKIDTETLETENIDIEGSYAIASPWATWKMSPIAADIHSNIVYYAKGTKVFSYNFDTKEFNADYFTFPGTADGYEKDFMLYAQSLSVDPATGNIVLVLVRSGWGANSQFNYVFHVDTATATIIEDKTLLLDEYYWFPAMVMYPGFYAPKFDVADATLAIGETASLDIAAELSLEVGNKHFVVYSATSSDPATVEVEKDGEGKFSIKGLADGTATVSVTASYLGRATSKDITVTVGKETDGVSSVTAADATADVYTATGVLVLRNATPEQIKALPAGIYISAGKKYMVK